MLEIAIALVASAALHGVAGSAVVPPSPVTALVDPLVYDPFRISASYDLADFDSRAKALPPELVTRLGGQALLRQLAFFDPDQIEEFVTDNPELVRSLLLDPPGSGKTEIWWKSLDPSVRVGMMRSATEIVGNLPGVPFETRDQANRSFLSKTIDELERKVETGIGRGAQTEVHARLGMLHEVELALGASPGEESRALINLDTVWPGRAAVALGNLHNADYVTYLVPGMFFNIEGQVGDWADTAAELREEESEWLDLLGPTDAGATPTVATVAWMGYETPNLFNFGSENLADDGALYLQSAMDSLNNARQGDLPFVSLLAHSYGSTAAMKALTTGQFSVDAFAIVGSPGSAAQSVDELHVKNRNMFVGEASWDPIIGTAFFGSNPGSPSYGAHRMSVAGGVDEITTENLSGSFGHNEYFATGSESLRNMALICIDRSDLVTEDHR